MNKKWIFVTLITLVAVVFSTLNVLASPVGVPSKDASGPNGGQTMENHVGIISAIDSRSLTLSEKDGGSTVFTLTADTKVKIPDMQNASIDDLKIGQKVTVRASFGGVQGNQQQGKPQGSQQPLGSQNGQQLGNPQGGQQQQSGPNGGDQPGGSQGGQGNPQGSPAEIGTVTPQVGQQSGGPQGGQGNPQGSPAGLGTVTPEMEQQPGGSQGGQLPEGQGNPQNPQGSPAGLGTVTPMPTFSGTVTSPSNTEAGGLVAMEIMVMPDKADVLHNIGVVTAYSSGSSITIQDQNGNSSTFEITSATKIIPADLADTLAVGMTVTIVRSRGESGDTLVADTIVIHSNNIPPVPTATSNT